MSSAACTSKAVTASGWPIDTYDPETANSYDKWTFKLPDWLETAPRSDGLIEIKKPWIPRPRTQVQYFLPRSSMPEYMSPAIAYWLDLVNWKPDEYHFAFKLMNEATGETLPVHPSDLFVSKMGEDACSYCNSRNPSIKCFVAAWTPPNPLTGEYPHLGPDGEEETILHRGCLTCTVMGRTCSKLGQQLYPLDGNKKHLFNGKPLEPLKIEEIYTVPLWADTEAGYRIVVQEPKKSRKSTQSVSSGESSRAASGTPAPSTLQIQDEQPSTSASHTRIASTPTTASAVSSLSSGLVPQVPTKRGIESGIHTSASKVRNKVIRLSTSTKESSEQSAACRQTTRLPPTPPSSATHTTAAESNALGIMASGVVVRRGDDGQVYRLTPDGKVSASIEASSSSSAEDHAVPGMAVSAKTAQRPRRSYADRLSITPPPTADPSTSTSSPGDSAFTTHKSNVRQITTFSPHDSLAVEVDRSSSIVRSTPSPATSTMRDAATSRWERIERGTKEERARHTAELERVKAWHEQTKETLNRERDDSLALRQENRTLKKQLLVAQEEKRKMAEGFEARVREELERARESWVREMQVEREREESKGRMSGAKAMGVKGLGRGKGEAMVIDLTFEDDD